MIKELHWQIDEKTCPNTFREFMKERNESMYTVKEMANVLNLEESYVELAVNNLSEHKKHCLLERGDGEWLITFKGAIYMLIALGNKPDIMNSVDRFEDLFCQKNGI